MTSVLRRFTLVLLVTQILLDVSSAYPIANGGNEKLNRFERSLQPGCGRKKHLRNKDGLIVVKGEDLWQGGDVSCSWIIHVSRGTLAQLQFAKFNIEDSCPGICRCNYVAVKEDIGTKRPVMNKYCNERKPPRDLVSGANKVRIHLSLKAGSRRTGNTSFVFKYAIMSSEKTTELATHGNKDIPGNDNSNEPRNIRVRKRVPGDEGSDVTAQRTQQDPGPSKLTIILAVAIPVVLIFLGVVLLIAYYYYYTDKKQKESGEDIPKSGATISDLIMNSSVTLTPMFNLGKARRESTQRKEKASKLYDDMLQNWRRMNDDKKKRELARVESVNTWESYKKHKQRRNTRDVEDANNEAFAMLVSNAINVAADTVPPPETQENGEHEVKETTEEVEEKPRTSSILIKRSSDSIRNSRGSKVLSWSDVSSSKPEEEKVNSYKRTKSETELKTLPRGSGGSAHIPAIVVSQPSVDAEDDETEANDTDRLIKVDKHCPKNQSGEGNEPKSSTTYSCSEHVKDILRESYGEEDEDWFQKPKKSPSQGSLHGNSESNVKYQAMKTSEDNDDID
ncbi:uncharacterized protein LOC114542142 [Dendronephthya gigantea]|uniref:uncharacterized protein LOC114542142 n=1 Tax=Dendronephthya gigantea TaxID=151771 RepID=UPI00106BE52D|nr:uncharacterized protein LOC114542142 [Dendronephthya gigantea]XP_028417690.1 uncharacterized protein LOC114542142 [Dendronephthya gigantea]XP_028417691.1 uncharacterized protein LOC114542142 [Dendronephthya gigantea]